MERTIYPYPGIPGPLGPITIDPGPIGFGPRIPALIFVQFQQNIFSYNLIFAAKSSFKRELDVVSCL